jgi:hypothetical protein
MALSAVTMSLEALRLKEGEVVARQAQGEMRMVDLRGRERGREGMEGCVWVVAERTPRARWPPAESPARMIWWC